MLPYLHCLFVLQCTQLHLGVRVGRGWCWLHVLQTVLLYHYLQCPPIWEEPLVNRRGVVCMDWWAILVCFHRATRVTMSICCIYLSLYNDWVYTHTYIPIYIYTRTSEGNTSLRCHYLYLCTWSVDYRVYRTIRTFTMKHWEESLLWKQQIVFLRWVIALFLLIKLRISKSMWTLFLKGRPTHV